MSNHDRGVASQFQWCFIVNENLYKMFLPLAKALSRAGQDVVLLDESDEGPLEAFDDLKIKRINIRAKMENEINAPFESEVLNTVWRHSMLDRLLSYFRIHQLSSKEKSQLRAEMTTVFRTAFSYLTKNPQAILVMEPVTDYISHTWYLVARQLQRQRFLLSGSRLEAEYSLIATCPGDVGEFVTSASPTEIEATVIANRFLARLEKANAPLEIMKQHYGVKSLTAKNFFWIMSATLSLLLKRKNLGFRRLARRERLMRRGLYSARAIFLDYFQTWDEPQEDDVYFYFPLHYVPEATSTYWANGQADQLALIKRVALSLKFGQFLYVKEHIYAAGHKPLSFYAELRKIPSIKLIDRQCDTLSLIRKSRGVVTINGTAGLEALFLKKPVLYFGDPIYDGFRGAYKVPPYNDSIETIRELLVQMNPLNNGDNLENRRLLLQQLRMWAKLPDLQSLHKGHDRAADLWAETLYQIASGKTECVP